MLTLEGVRITSLDLSAKENFYAGRKRFGLHHFHVVDTEGNQTFIRMSNAHAPDSDELENKIREVERFCVGDVVDVDVEPYDWKINDLTGTTHWYLGIRGA